MVVVMEAVRSGQIWESLLVSLSFIIFLNSEFHSLLQKFYFIWKFVLRFFWLTTSLDVIFFFVGSLYLKPGYEVL